MLAPFQARVDWQVGYFLSSSFLYILSFIFLFSSFAFQIWFAAMSNYQNNPWLVHVIYKLLKADPKTLALLDPVEGNPFGESQPTCIFSQPLSSHLLSPFLLQEYLLLHSDIKADLYEYHFTTYPTNTTWRSVLFSDDKNWWTRKYVVSLHSTLSFPPLSPLISF